jgi:hypothetical protein
MPDLVLNQRYNDQQRISSGALMRASDMSQKSIQTFNTQIIKAPITLINTANTTSQVYAMPIQPSTEKLGPETDNARHGEHDEQHQQGMKRIGPLRSSYFPPSNPLAIAAA